LSTTEASGCRDSIWVVIWRTREKRRGWSLKGHVDLFFFRVRTGGSFKEMNIYTVSSTCVCSWIRLSWVIFTVYLDLYFRIKFRTMGLVSSWFHVEHHITLALGMEYNCNPFIKNKRLGLNQVTSNGDNYKMKSFKFQISNNQNNLVCVISCELAY
jgi:hypothetical protein